MSQSPFQLMEILYLVRHSIAYPIVDFLCMTHHHSPPNIMLGSSLMEIIKPGCPGNVESGEGTLSWHYPRSMGSQCITIDCLGDEYLTINLGITSDWKQLHVLLLWVCERWRGRIWATGADWGWGRDPGSLTQSLSHSLSHSVSHSLTLSSQKMQK